MDVPEEQKIIDLHTHSTASDGSNAPEDIPALAVEQGVAAVALTDHDTVSGINAFLEAAGSYPQLTAIPGVELAALYGAREIHIVGLFLDHTSPEFNDFLARQREVRRRRNEEIRVKLNILGYPASWDEEEFSGRDPSSIGRPHFAAFLCRKYGFSGPQEVFKKLIGNSCPAYVPRKLPVCQEAIAAIHSAGGVAVWAHPIYRDKNESRFLRRVAKHLTAAGLDGIEGYYSLFSSNETKMVLECAGNNGLAVSGGSDYHGANSSGIRLGVGMGGLRVPFALLDALREKHRLVQERYSR